MLRETFAYAGGTRDPFNSLINMANAGPEITDLQLVGVYQDLRSPATASPCCGRRPTASGTSCG